MGDTCGKRYWSISRGRVYCIQLSGTKRWKGEGTAGLERPEREEEPNSNLVMSEKQEWGDETRIQGDETRR